MDPTINGEVMFFIQTVKEQLADHFQNLFLYCKENVGHLIWNLLVIFFIFSAAKAVLEGISHLTSRTMKRSHQKLDEFQSRRVDSLMTLTRSAARYLIYFVALLLVLGQFGGGTVQKVLLAVGSIGGIAFGFGAQNLVKDVVTGLFIIFENQFSVGDYIQTEEATGTVEAIAVRVTYLRSAKGDQIIVPNGSIGRVINYTRGSYVAVITVSTAYEADTRQVMQVMEEILAEYAEKYRELIEEPPVIRGIDTFGESTVDISVACRVKPMKQWEVERGMRLAIKEGFDRRGIEFPYPRMVTIPWGEHAAEPPAGAPSAPPPGWEPPSAPPEEEDGDQNDADGDGLPDGGEGDDSDES